MKSKIVPMNRHIGAGKDGDGRIALAVCREILHRRGRSYTDIEIVRIRDFLYKLAAIAIKEYEYQEQLRHKVINLEEYKKLQHAKSNYLRAG